MSQSSPHQPSRREVLKPVELLVGAAILAFFVALIVLMVVREFWLSGIVFGIVFIVTLVGLALFVQSMKPDAAEQAELSERDAAHGGTLPYLVARERRADGVTGAPAADASPEAPGSDEDETA